MEKIKISTILYYALAELDQVRQWVELKKWESVTKHHEAAKALIGMVEVETCGRIGGFAEDQRISNSHYERMAGLESQLKYSDKYENIFARLWFLVKKYDLDFKDKSERLHDVRSFFTR